MSENSIPNFESSQAGVPILRHQEKELDLDADIFVGEERIKALEVHLTEKLGECTDVFHEIFSEQVHIDVYIFAPRPKFPHYTLVTSGMSRKPMPVPLERKDEAFSELMLLLPPQWKLDGKSLQQERWFWPIHWLQFLARFPHVYDTCLLPTHTVPNQDPPQPLGPKVPFTGWLVMASRQFSRSFCEVPFNETEKTMIYTAYPLLSEEMEYKLANGSLAFLNKMGTNPDFNDCINLKRRSSLIQPR
jgi:hypothetical protein